MGNNETIKELTPVEIAIRTAILSYPKAATLDYIRVLGEAKKNEINGKRRNFKKGVFIL